MSRISYDDGDGCIPYGLWTRSIKNAIDGRRGQAALRLLVEGLDAMPEKRLIKDSLCRRGEVCTVGALIVQARVNKGEERAAVLSDLGWRGGYTDAFETAEEARKHVNIARIFAWRLVELNDEDTAGMTPEKRWQYVRDWATRRLRGETPAGAGAGAGAGGEGEGEGGGA